MDNFSHKASFILYIWFSNQNQNFVLRLYVFSAWFIEKEFNLSVKIVTKIDSTDGNSDVSHFFMSLVAKIV